MLAVVGRCKPESVTTTCMMTFIYWSPSTRITTVIYNTLTHDTNRLSDDSRTSPMLVIAINLPILQVSASSFLSYWWDVGSSMLKHPLPFRMFISELQICDHIEGLIFLLNHFCLC